MSRVVIVCGGRRYDNRARVFEELDKLHAAAPITLLRCGGATGADTLAASWAAANHVPTDVHRAQWGRHGRAAGPIRNAEMAELGADLCVAFAGGSGTNDMVIKACRAGIVVVRIP